MEAKRSSETTISRSQICRCYRTTERNGEVLLFTEMIRFSLLKSAALLGELLLSTLSTICPARIRVVTLGSNFTA